MLKLRVVVQNYWNARRSWDFHANGRNPFIVSDHFLFKLHDDDWHPFSLSPLTSNYISVSDVMNAAVQVITIAEGFIPVPGLVPALGIIQSIWNYIQKVRPKIDMTLSHVAEEEHQTSSNKKLLISIARFSTDILEAVNTILKENDMNDHIRNLLGKFEEYVAVLHIFFYRR